MDCVSCRPVKRRWLSGPYTAMCSWTLSEKACMRVSKYSLPPTSRRYLNEKLQCMSDQQIASGPGVISGFGRAFGEDLEFPLTLGDFSVDAFMIDTGGKTEVQVLFDDLSGQAAP